jgi:hypothetical protein
MTATSRRFSLIDAAAPIHSADCASWGAAPETRMDLAAGANDEVVGYAAEAGRVYADLRRLIGQVSGLLILAQASGRREAFELPLAAAARELRREIPDRMKPILPPRGLDLHFYRLHSAHGLIGECLDTLNGVGAVERGLDLTAALRKVAAAYRQLQSASEPALGMNMVDFSQACCSCGRVSR